MALTAQCNRITVGMIASECLLFPQAAIPIIIDRAERVPVGISPATPTFFYLHPFTRMLVDRRGKRHRIDIRMIHYTLKHVCSTFRTMRPRQPISEASYQRYNLIANNGMYAASLGELLDHLRAGFVPPFLPGY